MFDAVIIVINRDRALVVKPVTYERSKINDIGLAPVDPKAKDLTDELSICLREL